MILRETAEEGPNGGGVILNTARPPNLRCNRAHLDPLMKSLPPTGLDDEKLGLVPHHREILIVEAGENIIPHVDEVGPVIPNTLTVRRLEPEILLPVAHQGDDAGVHGPPRELFCEGLEDTGQWTEETLREQKGTNLVSWASNSGISMVMSGKKKCKGGGAPVSWDWGRRWRRSRDNPVIWLIGPSLTLPRPASTRDSHQSQWHLLWVRTLWERIWCDTSKIHKETKWYNIRNTEQSPTESQGHKEVVTIYCWSIG